MLKLYGFDTINTLKVLMLLMELRQEFEYVPINIRAGEQHTPAFLAVNPAGKVPVLSNGEHHQTESNAILLSLAKKADWGVTNDPQLHDAQVAWLFYQASTQGPHFGQIEHWTRFAQTPNPDALARHRAIADRTIAYLNAHLHGKQYLCGEVYSIADIALFPWLHIHSRLGLSLENAQHVAEWLARITKRPATMAACRFFGPNSIF